HAQRDSFLGAAPHDGAQLLARARLGEGVGRAAELKVRIGGQRLVELHERGELFELRLQGAAAWRHHPALAASPPHRGPARGRQREAQTLFLPLSPLWERGEECFLTPKSVATTAAHPPPAPRPP